MRPIVSSVTVPLPRAEVFAFLDVLANHARFTDHYLVDWTLGGPAAGVGGTARMRAVAPGRSMPLTMTVRESAAPERTVEESVDDTGERLNRGTYVLEDDVPHGTRVTFRFEQLRMPWHERILNPITRRWLQGANDRALRRLAGELAR